ncbi:MAG: PIG-L deacetylase family protein [Promethearchaeota archaeon]
MKNVIIISAHPDDETYGAGGTIAKLCSRGVHVELVIYTKAFPPEWDEDEIEKRKKEALAAAKVLGIKEVHFLGYLTTKLDVTPLRDLIDDLNQILKTRNADTLFLPFIGDMHQDHRRLFEVGVSVAKPTPEQTLRRILSYETLSSTEYGTPIFETPFIPNYYVNIKEHLDDKISAVSCYKLELREYPHPRSIEGVKTKAKARGMEVGLEFAEAFKILRWVSE